MREEKIFPRLTLFGKALIGFGVLAAMASVILWIGNSSARYATGLITQTVTGHVEQLDRVNHILATANKIRRMETDLGHFTDTFSILGACDEVEADALGLTDSIKTFVKTIHTDEHEHSKMLVANWEDYREHLGKVIGEVRDNRMAEASAISLHQTWPRFAVFSDQLEKLSSEINGRAADSMEMAVTSLEHRQKLLLWVTVAGTLIFIGSGLVFWRSILVRIRRLHLAAGGLTDGAVFSLTPETLGNDEIHDLGQILGEMSEKIKEREARLLEAQAQLEKRVEERTSELAQVNENLRREAEERLLAQAAREEAEASYRRLFEEAAEGLIIIDEGFQIVDMNSAAHRMHAIEPGRLASSLYEIISQDYSETIKEIFDCFIRNCAWMGEVEARRGDKSTFPAEVRSKNFNVGDKKLLLLTVRDITTLKTEEEEKRLLQNRLSRSEKMEALGILAGGVAHDLNNVLSPVVAYPDLLLEDMAPADPSRKLITRIQDSALKATAIVQDLLALARRGVTVRETVQINKLIEEYLSTFEGGSPGKKENIKIVADLDPELLLVWASPVHLYKVIMNLMQNALEASPENSTIRVSTRNQTVDLPTTTLRPGDYIVVEIEDHGCGIAEEHLPHIFEPFYSRKSMGQSGTGLGMAVVWGAVQDHGGHIEVKSEVHAGTTFTLYFPAMDRNQMESSATPTDIIRYGAGETILVVDDMDAQREVAVDILTRLQYDVRSVTSGESAVEWMRTKAADLVVLDMIMAPGIDGLETYRRILEVRPGTRAVICSGFAESERVREAQKLGAGQYIRKPFTMNRLGKAVRAELDRK